jgi:hypothetical protein
MKLSAIGASIVGLATGVGAILTVVEQWHNIEQWNKPAPNAAVTAAVLPVEPSAAIPASADAAVHSQSAPGLSGCFLGSVGSALAPFAQCGNFGPLSWGLNQLKICLSPDRSSDQATAIFQEDRNFLEQNGLSVIQEHAQTHVTDFASNSVDLELIYTRTDINAYGTQVPVLVEATLSCHGGEGALDCRVQPQRVNYNGVACGIVGDEVQASLAGQ